MGERMTEHIRKHFGQFLNENNIKGVGLELGVGKGKFAQIYGSFWKGDHIFLVDIWQKQDKKIYDDLENENSAKQLFAMCDTVRMTWQFPGLFSVLKMDSERAASIFKDNYLDWIYIDANHRYEAIKKDLEIWWPKVKKGGFFGGHDYMFYIEVERAVKEFFAKKGIDFECDGHNWWVFK